jgi:DNA-binding LacI/PurR family transcriptional regulator
MRAETLARVESVMRDLGFAPSRTARQLRSGAGKTIALVVPSVANPFWGTAAHEVESAAMRYDYQVLLCNSERDADRERRYLLQLWADGVRDVILGSSLRSIDHLKDLMDRGLRVIAFDREIQPSDHPAVISLSVDNRRGARMAVEHLLRLGHQRIALISPPIKTLSRAQRLEGCRDAVAASGSNAELVVWEPKADGRFGDTEAAELGQEGARALLAAKRRPTAIFAINDFCAIGACAAAREVGLKVPDDVSVVGFDDIPLAAMVDPPLTTVRQPIRAIATFAVDLVRSGPDSAPSRAEFPLTLVERASTARQPASAA